MDPKRTMHLNQRLAHQLCAISRRKKSHVRSSKPETVEALRVKQWPSKPWHPSCLSRLVDMVSCINDKNTSVRKHSDLNLEPTWSRSRSHSFGIGTAVTHKNTKHSDRPEVGQCLVRCVRCLVRIRGPSNFGASARPDTCDHCASALQR